MDPIVNNMINEDLGNLAQLNVGPMINVLKQQPYYSRRRDSELNFIGPRFVNRDIGSTSEVVDIGVLKNGLTTLRKAFKDSETAKAFAVYIGGKAVMFGVTDSHQLAGSSRDNIIAYDLTPWKEYIDAAYEKQWNKPSASTARTVDAPRYSDDQRPRNYAGRLVDTGNLSSLFTMMQAISKETKQPMTAKLVMADVVGREKQRKRFSAREIRNGAKDLRTRLAFYKNSKKPTVNTVKEFIAMSLKNPGSKVQFAGITYSLKSSSYDKVDPTNLLRGIPFSVSYSSVDPGIYDSLSIIYKFDVETNQLLPIKASFRDKRGDDSYKSQEEILDPRLYLIHTLQTRNLDNKDVMIRRVLTMIKERKLKDALTTTQALEMMGTDWPELEVIRTSIEAALDNP